MKRSKDFYEKIIKSENPVLVRLTGGNWMCRNKDRGAQGKTVIGAYMAWRYKP